MKSIKTFGPVMECDSSCPCSNCRPQARPFARLARYKASHTRYASSGPDGRPEGLRPDILQPGNPPPVRMPANQPRADDVADRVIEHLRGLAASEAKRKEGDGPVPGQPWHPSGDIRDFCTYAQTHGLSGPEAVRRYWAEQTAHKVKAVAAMPARTSYTRVTPGTRQPAVSRPSVGGMPIEDCEYGAVQALAAREGLSPMAALSKYKASKAGC